MQRWNGFYNLRIPKAKLQDGLNDFRSMTLRQNIEPERVIVTPMHYLEDHVQQISSTAVLQKKNGRSLPKYGKIWRVAAGEIGRRPKERSRSECYPEVEEWIQTTNLGGSGVIFTNHKIVLGTVGFVNNRRWPSKTCPGEWRWYAAEEAAGDTKKPSFGHSATALWWSWGRTLWGHENDGESAPTILLGQLQGWRQGLVQEVLHLCK